jgi:hypothetical protein
VRPRDDLVLAAVEEDVEPAVRLAEIRRVSPGPAMRSTSWSAVPCGLATVIA